MFVQGYSDENGHVIVLNDQKPEEKKEKAQQARLAADVE